MKLAGAAAAGKECPLPDLIAEARIQHPQAAVALGLMEELQVLLVQSIDQVPS